MADLTWLASTIAKVSAAPLDGTELIRVVNDPGGTPASQKAAISDVRAYLLATANAWTAAQTLASTTLGFSGNQTKAAWTTAGAKLKDVPGTLTDTTSSGTVADARTNVLGGDTIAASSATTFTDYYNAFLSQPVAGSNVTFTNRWALGLDGGLKITPSANANALVVSGYNLTGANAQSALSITGTWNTSGTPIALLVSLTDTASPVGSILAQFTSTFGGTVTINKGGQVVANGGFVTNSNSLFTANDLRLGGETFLSRDAANVFAQRNGTSAQEHRWYNTFTDASNYERMSLAWSSNVAIMKPQNAGTGSARLFVPVTGATVVASLPSAATMGAGARSMVTNHTGAVVFGTAPTAGGSVVTPVYSDGTNWLMG